MRRIAIAATLLPGTLLASPIGFPVGANLTYGDISIDHNIMSNITNPAFSSVSLDEGENRYRFGVINAGVKMELGKLDDVINKADNISTQLDVPTTGFTTSQAGGVITITPTGSGTPVNIDTNTIISDSIASMSSFTGTQAEYQTELQKRISANIESQMNVAVAQLAQPYLDTINTTITPVTTELNDNGYMKLGANAYVPLTPLVVTNKALGGSITLEANYSVLGKISYVSTYVKPSATIDLNSVTFAGGDPTVASNWNVNGTTLTPQFTIDTDAAIAIKTATTKELGFGYSRKVFSHEKGSLHVGGRLKYYQVGLAKSYTTLVGTQDNKQKLRDQMDASMDTKGGVGLDIGALWQADNYRLGATVNNINAPSFTYKNISACSDFHNYVDPVTSAVTSSKTLADCNTKETYTMDPQLRLEAATSAWNDRVTLGLGYDANAIKDAVGTEYKWLTVSAGANLGNWAAIRGGYRSNRATNGLNYISAGVTLLGITLDGAVTTDKVTVDGKSVPRSFMANLGWNLTF